MRKGSFGMAVLALALSGAMLTTTACSTTWVTDAEQIVAALIPAAGNVIALVGALDGNGVSAADIQAVTSAGTQAQADLQLISSLITQYQSATDATTKASLLTKIQAAITATQANLSGILPALHISDPATQAKVSAVIGLILSEVQSLAAVVPLVSAAASLSEKASATKALKVKPPLSAAAFTKSFNATISAKTGNVVLDKATAAAKIKARFKL